MIITSLRREGSSVGQGVERIAAGTSRPTDVVDVRGSHRPVDLIEFPQPTSSEVAMQADDYWVEWQMPAAHQGEDCRRPERDFRPCQ
jgi:hypothetical protein